MNRNFDEFLARMDAEQVMGGALDTARSNMGYSRGEELPADKVDEYIAKISFAMAAHMLAAYHSWLAGE